MTTAERIAEIETKNIPHAKKMYYYWLGRANKNERGAKKSMKFWLQAYTQYTIELDNLKKLLGA